MLWAEEDTSLGPFSSPYICLWGASPGPGGVLILGSLHWTSGCISTAEEKHELSDPWEEVKWSSGCEGQRHPLVGPGVSW